MVWINPYDVEDFANEETVDATMLVDGDFKLKWLYSFTLEWGRKLGEPFWFSRFSEDDGVTTDRPMCSRTQRRTSQTANRLQTFD